MQFKKFLLDDYLQTDDGKKCYEFFQNIKDISLILLIRG